MSMMNRGSARAAGDGFHIAARDDRPLGARRRHHDIRAPHGGPHVAPGHRVPADLGGERLRVRHRPARDDDLRDAVAAQVLRRQRADFAGADNQHAPAVEPAEDLSRQRHRGKADGDRALAERGLGAHALADAECPVKRFRQQWAAAPASWKNRCGWKTSRGTWWYSLRKVTSSSWTRSGSSLAT